MARVRRPRTLGTRPEEHAMIHPALRYVPTPHWAVLAWSLPYGWYEPPPPPDPASLPPPGRYHVDPARSSVRAEVRGYSRRERATADGVTGTLRFGRGSATVELAVEAAGLHTGDAERDRALHGLLDPASFPLLRFTACGLHPAHGAWLVPGQVTLRGRVAPVALWLDATGRTDGAVTVVLRGALERAASGLRRRVALELTLVAAPEPVSFAPPCIAGVAPGSRAPARLSSAAA
jgi:polyisoprenoid-binding protein YceI